MYENNSKLDIIMSQCNVIPRENSTLCVLELLRKAVWHLHNPLIHTIILYYEHLVLECFSFYIYDIRIMLHSSHSVT